MVRGIIMAGVVAIALLAPTASALGTAAWQPNVENPVTADDFYRRGLLRALFHNDAPGALEDFNQALRLDPTETRVYHPRGISRMELGDLEGAIQDFNEALRVDSNLAEAYLTRGRAWAGLGDVQRALGDLQTAAQMFLARGDNPRYSIAIGEIERLQGTAGN